MMTTVTTTTTTAASMGLGTGTIAVMTLIAFLTIKELSNSALTEDHDENDQQYKHPRLRLMAERLNIVVYPLLFIFAAIVMEKVLTILVDGFEIWGYSALWG